jgi:predicted transcriptional regulator
MSMSVTAKDIFSKRFNSVKENDTLSRCLESFKKGMPPVLAVLDEKGKYVGMITRLNFDRDLTHNSKANL